jgi:hypothetical protein
VLRWLRAFAARHPEAELLPVIAACLEQLEGAVAAGQFGCMLENYCQHGLYTTAWWARANPGVHRHPFPVSADEAARLRRVLDLDARRRLDGAGVGPEEEGPDAVC